MIRPLTLGFALTEHCNLRCAHCIRDDVTSVRSLAPSLVFATIDAVRDLRGAAPVASFTGGEPLLHPEWETITTGLRERKIAWRLTSNGWHVKRLAAAIDAWAPALVRLSLSGADADTHDAERGRGSFDRILQSLAVLTSRRIPTALSLIIDTRTRDQIESAAALARALGVNRLHFILPQPVPGSVARETDVPPSEWSQVRDEVHTIARQSEPTIVQLDYGAPFDGEEATCDSLSGDRLYVDARGRVSTCCQLSEYGFVATDVIGDLNDATLASLWPEIERRRAELAAQQAKRFDAADGLDPFPCLRCARATGKLDWLRDFAGTPWHRAAFGRAARSILFAVASTVASTLAVACADTSVAPSPTVPRIAFAYRTAGGTFDIWSARLDGTELVNLTPDSPLDDSNPTVGCGQIFFASLRSGRSALYSMPVTGGSATAIGAASATARTSPSVNTSCTQLAFVTPVAGLDRIAVSDARLAASAFPAGAPNAAALEGNPALSPDGSRLASWNTATGAPTIAVLALSSGTAQSFAAANSTFAPAWRGDGQRLAVASNRDTTDGGPTSIYEITLATSQWRRVSVGTGAATDPVYLPDGRIVYVVFLSPTSTELRWIDPNVPGLGGRVSLPAGIVNKPVALP